MTIFEWLLIGHLIGDWAFQNEWMVRHKQNSLFNRAVFIHCGVYTAVLLVTALAVTRGVLPLDRYMVFVVVVYLTHWLIDAMDAAGHWMRLFQQSDVTFVRIVVDQGFHLLVIALLIQFLLMR